MFIWQNPTDSIDHIGRLRYVLDFCCVQILWDSFDITYFACGRAVISFQAVEKFTPLLYIKISNICTCSFWGWVYLFASHSANRWVLVKAINLIQLSVEDLKIEFRSSVYPHLAVGLSPQWSTWQSDSLCLFSYFNSSFLAVVRDSCTDPI